MTQTMMVPTDKLCQFLAQRAAAVARRIHLDGQVRRHRRHRLTHLGPGPARVAVEGDIGASDRVRTALGEYGRVVRESVSPTRRPTVSLEDETGIHTNPSVFR